MGALTLKTYPFELRGWDIEKFKSIDPTDGFGINTSIYISKNQIVQIEPEYDSQILNSWVTDKGRQFFDSIFGSWSYSKKTDKKLKFSKQSWELVTAKLIKSIYMSDHCNGRACKSYFLTLVFEDISLELLGLFNTLAQKYSFIKIKTTQKLNNCNDLESNFQLTSSVNKTNLTQSNYCLLVGLNSRYEGFHLNLRLRQRFLKGNFVCMTLGPILNLTFKNINIGSNINTFKAIVEGNNVTSQMVRFANNPITVLSNEILKRQDSNNLIKSIKLLHFGNTLNTTGLGLNLLNTSIYDTNTQIMNCYKRITLSDINTSNSLYLINVSSSNIFNFKAIMGVKLLNFFGNKSLKKIKVLIDQSPQVLYGTSFLSNLSDKKAGTCVKIPVSTFYENNETFINTEGYFKKVSKNIFRKETKNNSQLIKRVMSLIQKNIVWLNRKNNGAVFYSSSKLLNYINFLYCSTESLASLNTLTITKNSPFFLYKKSIYSLKLFKLNNTKIKYWLDDFFIGGKDTYSRNSLVMINSSKLLKKESTNFF